VAQSLVGKQSKLGEDCNENSRGGKVLRARRASRSTLALGKQHRKALWGEQERIALANIQLQASHPPPTVEWHMGQARVAAVGSES